ncbi:hypothetical protein, partial [Candidatus Methanoperedens sp. BLZ2]|uniref:hypothetical protein n=1 Tax=Candidatus Methanoperedens sp. BLZ2 TaxID=2035255 RepID=UPI001C3E89AC
LRKIGLCCTYYLKQAELRFNALSRAGYLLSSSGVIFTTIFISTFSFRIWNSVSDSLKELSIQPRTNTVIIINPANTILLLTLQTLFYYSMLSPFF